MSDNPQDHDFDWITPRCRCLHLEEELLCLRTLVEDWVKTRMDNAPERRAAKLEFFTGDEHSFGVARYSAGRAFGSPVNVWFMLLEDHILIQDNWSETDNSRELRVTATLTEEGEYRLQLDGEGEYLRWQMVRKALEPIMFGPPRSR